MSKHVVMGLLASCGVALWSGALGQGQPAAPGAADDGAAQAARRAREVLAERLHIPAQDIVVERTEATTWSDSSLGCGARGTQALQRITAGHVVLLAAQGRTYRVHVAGSQALICDRPVPRRDALRKPRYARGLDAAFEKARGDLAARLGIDAGQVRMVGMQPASWTDEALGCAAGAEAAAGPVEGYRLALEAGGRLYTYHTDLSVVRPCPPIEAQ